MPSLPETQRSFAAVLLGDGPSPSWGHSVYRGNVLGNWSGALAIAYPITRKVVGAGFFDAMARHFAAAHPSRSGDLHDYGDALADFLETYEHTADLPYLPDVARMEWLAHRAFYASDPPVFDPAPLAAMPPERLESLRPRLTPGCALLTSPWPLARLWHIHQDEYRGEFSVDLASGPDRLVVHRAGWRATVESLESGDFRFLAGAALGEPLGESLEAALSADPSFDPANALVRWIRSGALSF